MANKRERSLNFSKDEIDSLINLVEERKEILENKKSDLVTWQEKEKCWEQLEAAFNSKTGGPFRSVKALRTKYEGIKRDTRKKFAILHAETYRTGGGSKSVPTITPAEEKLKKMILLSVEGMQSCYDSDNVQDKAVPASLPLPAEDHAPDVSMNPNNLDDFIEISLDGIEEYFKVPQKPVSQESLPSLPRDDQASKPSNIKTDGLPEKKRWDQWKPKSLKSKKHPALCNPKHKKPFEKIAEAKLEVIALQKQVLEEDLLLKKREKEELQKKWDFEEEERQHKRKMWALELKHFVDKHEKK